MVPPGLPKQILRQSTKKEGHNSKGLFHQNIRKQKDGRGPCGIHNISGQERQGGCPRDCQIQREVRDELVVDVVVRPRHFLVQATFLFQISRPVRAAQIPSIRRETELLHHDTGRDRRVPKAWSGNLLDKSDFRRGAGAVSQLLIRVFACGPLQPQRHTLLQGKEWVHGV